MIATSPSAAGDRVSVFLDPTAAGKDSLEISADLRGPAQATWRHFTIRPQPNDDGSPNSSYPASNFPLPNLATASRIGTGEYRGNSVWTAVVTIPLTELPPALRSNVATDGHWKVNVLRLMATRSSSAASGLETVQSNLSPVRFNTQPVCPYRMADLVLAP